MSQGKYGSIYSTVCLEVNMTVNICNTVWHEAGYVAQPKGLCHEAVSQRFPKLESAQQVALVTCITSNMDMTREVVFWRILPLIFCFRWVKSHIVFPLFPWKHGVYNLTHLLSTSGYTLRATKARFDKCLDRVKAPGTYAFLSIRGDK